MKTRPIRMDARPLGRGVSCLALVAGIGLFSVAAAAPAQAHFFSWFSRPAEPVVRARPPRDPMRAAARPRAKRIFAGVAKPDPAARQSVGPLIIVVSVNRQRLTVYDGERAIASSPVSTGKTGHETPLGLFSVIQKEKLHHSNLYNDAPMPYMQRITWSGVALHAGPLPGRAASHGCVRLPADFAVRLWNMTKIGARVIVARNDIAPARPGAR